MISSTFSLAGANAALEPLVETCPDSGESDASNLYGGGISIGHPPGATGVRTMTALQHVEDTGSQRAILIVHGRRSGAGHAGREATVNRLRS